MPRNTLRTVFPLRMPRNTLRTVFPLRLGQGQICPNWFKEVQSANLSNLTKVVQICNNFA